MNDPRYKLDFWNQYKTDEARVEVVQFVVKTLDKIAFPLIIGETIHLNLFKITHLILSKFKRFDEI